MKNTSVKQILPYLPVALVLCILPAILQTHLKKMPQHLMLLVAALTIIALLTGSKALSRALFYLLFAFILFINIEQLVYQSARIMNIDMSFFNLLCVGCSPSYGGLILGNIIGFFLALFLVWKYHKKNYSDLFPWCLSICFFIITAAIYTCYEIL